VKVTADDIAQLLASSPPRNVPAHVAKAAKGGGAVLGVLFGLAFGGFGMIFVVLFFPWRLGEELRLSFGTTLTVPGIVADAYPTSLSVNDEKVYGYLVSYAVDAGGPRTATCFTTGQRWSKGASVTVRYVPSNPAVACLEGARVNRGGFFGSFVVIFPLIGFGIAGGIFLARGRTARLLRDGVAAEVDVLAVDATNVRVNYQTVYKITVSSPNLANGQPVSVKRYNKADVDLATRYALQKQPVFILHDPRKPQRLIFPEALIEP
jgi:hypothetical protein